MKEETVGALKGVAMLLIMASLLYVVGMIWSGRFNAQMIKAEAWAPAAAVLEAEASSWTQRVHYGRAQGLTAVLVGNQVVLVWVTYVDKPAQVLGTFDLGQGEIVEAVGLAEGGGQ